MWTNVSSWTLIGALVLSVTTDAGTPASPPTLTWEAEDLGATVKVTGGGEVYQFGSTDRVRFSRGEALSFVPRGKGSGMELVVQAPSAGVYVLVFRTVMGPSNGIYRVLINRTERGHWYNLSASKQVCCRELSSKRALFRAGPNRVRFELVERGPRGGTMVLDRLRLERVKRSPGPPRVDPHDKKVPTHEKLGANLIRNGGFEAFGPNDRYRKRADRFHNWALNSPAPATPCIVRDPSLAHSGRQALRLAPDPLEDNVAVYQAIRATSGKRYRVSLYARGSGYLYVYLYQYGVSPKGTDSLRANVHFKVTDRWQLYSYVMSPSRSGRVHSVGLALYGAADSEVYFDDVAVQEVLSPARGR